MASLTEEGRRSESESEQGEIQSLGVDPKPDDLSMVRLKVW